MAAARGVRGSSRAAGRRTRGVGMPPAAAAHCAGCRHPRDQDVHRGRGCGSRTADIAPPRGRPRVPREIGQEVAHRRASGRRGSRRRARGSLGRRAASGPRHSRHGRAGRRGICRRRNRVRRHAGRGRGRGRQKALRGSGVRLAGRGPVGPAAPPPHPRHTRAARAFKRGGSTKAAPARRPWRRARRRRLSRSTKAAPARRPWRPAWH